MGLVSSDDGWRLPDWLWERVEPLLPAPPTHPLGCHRPRVSDRAAMDAILLVLRTGMRSGSRPGCSMRFGGKDCSITTSRSGSTGPGSRATGRPGRRRLVARRRDRIRLIELKGGEAFASLRGGRGPDRAGA